MSNQENRDQIMTMGGLPVGFLHWPDFEKHKQAIIDLCLANEKQNTVESDVGTSIKNNLWESKFDFLNGHTELSELNTWLTMATNDFVNVVNNREHKLGIIESWAHVTRPGGYHGPHRHPTSTWSGIFYVDADDYSDGAASNMFFNHFTMPRLPGYEFFEEQIEIQFKPGLLVIFPSTMLHYAKPYLGKDRRIVIAFNSFVFKQ